MSVPEGADINTYSLFLMNKANMFQYNGSLQEMRSADFSKLFLDVNSHGILYTII